MNGLDIATDGYWSNQSNSVATNGYWYIEVIIEDKTHHHFNKPFYVDLNEDDNILQFKSQEEIELVLIIKSFLICQS